MKYVALFVSAFSILAGCGGSDDAVPRTGPGDTSTPQVTETKEEAEARADRAKMREFFRAQGKRVCEEGEVGTQWMEDCNTCGCHTPGVRGCTKKRCDPPGPPPTRILRRTPPEPPSNGDESGPKK